MFGKVIEISKDLTGKDLTDAINAGILNEAAPYAAAAAVAGITIGTMIGAAFLFIRHKFVGDKFTEEELLLSPPPRTNRENLKMILSISIPIVFGSLATNLASLIDLTTVLSRLSWIYSPENGKTVIDLIYGKALTNVDNVPNFLYGCYKGYAFQFYSLIPTLASVIGISALPNLASAWINKNTVSVRKNIESVIRITALMAIPCGIGLSLMGNPVLTMLYSQRPDEVTIAAKILVILGVASIFAALAIPMTSMLQAIGKQKIPVRNILVAGVLKIVVNFFTVGTAELNIQGAAFGTLVCYGYLFFSNLYCLCKYSGVVPNIWKTMVKPLIASVMCIAAVWVSYDFMQAWLSKSGKPSVSLIGLNLRNGTVAIISAMAIGGIIYLFSLFLIRAITRDDIKMLPKGEKIANILAKFRLIG